MISDIERSAGYEPSAPEVILATSPTSKEATASTWRAAQPTAGVTRSRRPRGRAQYSTESPCQAR